MAAREIESIKVGFHSMLRLVPRHLEREELPVDLGSVQKRSLGGERRYSPDPTKKFVMRDDRRNLQRRDRREPKSLGRAGRKPVR
jgi:hypothetical protein